MSDAARDPAPDPDPDPRTSWTARRGPLLTVALIVGISPFATDLYIPGLPAIAADLDASTASVQLTLTAFLVAAVGGIGPALVWPALDLVTAGWGWVIPGSITLTQALGHRHAGTASALVGGLQFGLGGLATPLAGALGGTATAMGALMSGFIAIGLAAQLWASRASTGG